MDPQGFHFRHGQLYCEDVHVENFFDTLDIGKSQVDVEQRRMMVDIPPTPAYIYSLATLKANVRMYQEAIARCKIDAKLGYAVKANGNLVLLKILKASGVEMLVTVSGNEILAGIQAGFDPDRIIFNGNGKQEWEIKLGMELGVMLNVDSTFDANNIMRIKMQFHKDKDVRVLLRIRPTAAVHKEAAVHPYVNTAESSKFGFGVEELDQVLDLLMKGAVTVHGIHCHLGSCIYDPDVFHNMGDIMTEIMNELKKRGHDIKLLDIGGGIGIDYHKTVRGFDTCTRDDQKSKDTTPQVHDFMSIIQKAFPSDVTVILEPGRSLIANTCAVICKVLGTKRSKDKAYMVVDAAMTEVIRPCLYSAHHNIYPTSKVNDTDKWKKYEVVGPICETGDFLGHDIPLPDEPCSTYLAIMDTGAYCSSMSSNYNMRPRPIEVLVDGSKTTIIRNRETYQDLVSPQTLAPSVL